MHGSSTVAVPVFDMMPMIPTMRVAFSAIVIVPSDVSVVAVESAWTMSQKTRGFSVGIESPNITPATQRGATASTVGEAGDRTRVPNSDFGHAWVSRFPLVTGFVPPDLRPLFPPTPNGAPE